jgi:hypothetical protein
MLFWAATRLARGFDSASRTGPMQKLWKQPYRAAFGLPSGRSVAFELDPPHLQPYSIPHSWNSLCVLPWP